jgi:putative transposase
MTRQTQSNELYAIVQLLAEYGFDGMSQAMEILLNEAMKLQRSEALGALPYQRTADRRGYANGFKPKTVHSRLGTLQLEVPQTRDVEFYPTVLERASGANGP